MANKSKATLIDEILKKQSTSMQSSRSDDCEASGGSLVCLGVDGEQINPNDCVGEYDECG